MVQPKFRDETERELFARAVLGEKCIQFLHTDVGRYLKGRAENEIIQCQVDALNCDPDAGLFGRMGRNRLRKVRLRAAAAENFLKWLADAITDGEHAGVELESYRSGE